MGAVDSSTAVVTFTNLLVGVKEGRGVVLGLEALETATEQSDTPVPCL